MKKCPICGKDYSKYNPKSYHHVLPFRFFGEGELAEMCRNCHNNLERLIPFKQIDECQYKQILCDFVKKVQSLPNPKDL